MTTHLQALDNAEAERRRRVVARESLIEELTRQKDAAYAERNQVVALAARLALHHPSCFAYLGRDVSVAPEDEWSNVVFVILPGGVQLSWHIHDRELPLFARLPDVREHMDRFRWDGHTTEEKYERLRAYVAGPFGPPKPALDATQERAKEKILEQAAHARTMVEGRVTLADNFLKAVGLTLADVNALLQPRATERDPELGAWRFYVGPAKQPAPAYRTWGEDADD